MWMAGRQMERWRLSGRTSCKSHATAGEAPSEQQWRTGFVVQLQVSLGSRANLWQFWIEIIAGYKEKRHSGGDKVRDSVVAFSGHGCADRAKTSARMDHPHFPRDGIHDALDYSGCGERTGNLVLEEPLFYRRRHAPHGVYESEYSVPVGCGR